MKIEWLYEARREYADLLTYYRYQVGMDAARRFSSKIMDSVENLSLFPEMGVLKQDTLLGKYGLRALFIEQYVCLYRISSDTIYICHLSDARKNYIYSIVGLE